MGEPAKGAFLSSSCSSALASHFFEKLSVKLLHSSLFRPNLSMATIATSSASSEPAHVGLTAAEQETLKASTFQRLYPRVYLERFLAEGFRPDGRSVDTFRDMTVNVGKPSRHLSSGFKRFSLVWTDSQDLSQLPMVQHLSSWEARPLYVASKPRLQSPSSTSRTMAS
jgi:polyribonucleotide nucleotidyltransferase